MTPVSFPGQNKVLQRPASMDASECSGLAVFTDGRTCLSEWELSDEEVKAIMQTKRVRLWVWSGSTQPPVALAVVTPV